MWALHNDILDFLFDVVKGRSHLSDFQQTGCLLDGIPKAPDQAQAMVDAKLKAGQVHSHRGL